MSGGEKARLVLCMIVWQKPNLLLLDEPTNHLDLATREALSMALNEFEGTVMLVSHDRALLRAVCDEFWMVSRGKVYPFEGDLEDYQQFLLDEAKRQRDEAKKLSSQSVLSPATTLESPITSTTTKKPFLSTEQKKLKKRLEQLENQISKENRLISDLESQISQSNEMTQITLLGIELANIQKSLQTNEEQWVLLSEEFDLMSNDY
jgi:ATP-binding cassette subfamily F protein 3